MASYNLTSTTPSASWFITGDIIQCPYNGGSKTIELPAGTYKLECWGAQGGSYSNTYEGGKGGYSVGQLAISENTTLYLHAGGAGSQISSTGTQEGGGYNGGGHATTTSTSYFTCGGGGASDIRIGQDSLYSRVIVAGGGGGAMGATSGYGNGGYGGGDSGGAGASSSSTYTPGQGGTQTAAGDSYYGSSLAADTRTDLGGFGFGASALTPASYSTGGGGGWYGGGSARRAGGGGGSGYVYTTLTATKYPSGCTLSSIYYLSVASTEDGSTSFLSPTGTSETGHSGNGYVKITIISLQVEGTPPEIEEGETTSSLLFNSLSITKAMYGTQNILKMYYNHKIVYSSNGESGGDSGGTEEPEEPTSYTKMYLTCPNTYGNTATRSLDYGEYYNNVTIFESTGGYRLWYNVAKNADTGNRYMTVWFGNYDENIYYWHSTSGTSTYVDELDLPSDFGTIETVGTTSIAQKMYNSYLTFA